jgi:chaperone BCS1
MSWIARQPGFNKSRYMEVTTRYSSSEGSSILFGDEEAVDDDDKALKYIPSPSIAYSLWYKRRWVEVTRTKTGGSSYYDSETDRLTVRILTRNRRLVNSLLLEAKRLYATANEESVCVYVNDQADQWRFVACVLSD